MKKIATSILTLLIFSLSFSNLSAQSLRNYQAFKGDNITLKNPVVNKIYQTNPSKSVIDAPSLDTFFIDFTNKKISLSGFSIECGWKEIENEGETKWKVILDNERYGVIYIGIIDGIWNVMAQDNQEYATLLYQFKNISISKIKN